MSIESSHPTKGANTSVAESKHAKGKSSASDAAAPGGDFLALLASMDSSLAVEPDIDSIATESLANTHAGAVVVGAAIDPLNGLSEFAKFVDGSDTQETTGLGADVGSEPGKLGKWDEASIRVDMSQGQIAGMPYAPVVPPLVPAAPTESHVFAGGNLATLNRSDNLSVVTSGAQEDRAAALEMSAGLQARAAQPQPLPQQPVPSVIGDPALVLPLGAPVGLGVDRPAPVFQPEAALTALSPLLSAGAEPGGKTSKLQRDLAKQESMQGAIVGALGKATNELEVRANLVIAKPIEQALAQLTQSASLSTTLIPLRRDDQIRERSAFRPGLTEANAVGQPLFSVAGSSSVQYTPEIAAYTEQQIAEKVAYWVSNDVQSAELKLEGLGLEPVEVTIRMQGNEAHVAFRTDELQARAALENASVHLKDLLMREGLVLSGVSVGTAGTGDSGTQERKQRQGVRQAVVAPAIPALAERGPSSARVAGSTLDLFV